MEMYLKRFHRIFLDFIHLDINWKTSIATINKIFKIFIQITE